jgi:hypothetical protein
MAGIDRANPLPAPSQQPRRGLTGAGKADDEERPSWQRGANFLGRDAEGHPESFAGDPDCPLRRLGGESQAWQGRRERRVLCTQATEDAARCRFAAA